MAARVQAASAVADVLTLDGDVTLPEAAGLLAVPERYRLQFLLLAAGRLPRAGEVVIARTAARLAERTAIPPELLDGHAAELDAWFREHAAQIVKRADAITRWPRLAARIRRLFRAGASLWRR